MKKIKQKSSLNDIKINNDRNLCFSFGSFKVLPVGRKLLYRGHEIPLGGRAFDILLVLLEAAGEVVSQQDINQRVWPGLWVDEANLRVHMAGLRKILRQHGGEERYIATIPRRGYAFCEPVSRNVDRQTSAKLSDTLNSVSASPPRLIGRDQEIFTITKLLKEKRFVSIIGAGGVGKTSVALAVAHSLQVDGSLSTYFVDLGGISRGDRIGTAIAAALSFSPRSDDVVAEICAHLQNRNTLLLLDNCEHLLPDLAPIAGRLYAEAQTVHLLTTTREALRLAAEEIYLLAALASPPEGTKLTKDEVEEWSAIELFLERARSSGYRDELSDQSVTAVAGICDKLDGNALAIELVASRVANHGIFGMADLLERNFKLEWYGRRDAIERHRNLGAMVEWSYETLMIRDRIVLARLSVIVGFFSLSIAQQVAADDELTADQVEAAVVSLVEKSLLSVSEITGRTCYRLLDTTKSYAANKLHESGEKSAVCRRHLDCISTLLTGFDDNVSAAGETLVDDLPNLMGNLRAALDWSAAAEGDHKALCELTAIAAPLFLGNSMLKECREWCELAFASMPEDLRNTEVELALWEGFAISAMFTRGNGDEIAEAIDTAVTIARTLARREYEMRLLAGLHIYKSRIGDFSGLIDVSRQALEVAEELKREDYHAMAEWMMATALHLCGDQASAYAFCKRAMRRPAGATFHLDAFGYDHRIRGQIVLVRVLWLLGYLDQAANLCTEIVKEAVQKDHAVGLCIALIYTTTVAIWSKNFVTARERIDLLLETASINSLEPYRAVGLALRGEAAVMEGILDEGIMDLRTGLTILNREQHNVITTEFLVALAIGVAQTGAIEEAHAILDQADAQAQRQSELYLAPEILRARGEIYHHSRDASQERSEQLFQESIISAAAQGTMGWELRSTLSLALLLSGLEREEEANKLLQDILQRLPTDASISDLSAAKAMLAHSR
jgi:predicted ATPase/DNA-binding winged helix-turn-helix (wHTH) protein